MITPHSPDTTDTPESTTMMQVWNDLAYVLCAPTSMCFGEQEPRSGQQPHPNSNDPSSEGIETSWEGFSSPKTLEMLKSQEPTVMVASTVVADQQEEEEDYEGAVVMNSPSSQRREGVDGMTESPRELAPTSPVPSEFADQRSVLPSYFRSSNGRKEEDDDSAHLHLRAIWEIKKAKPLSLAKGWAAEESKFDDDDTLSTQSSYSISSANLDENETYKLLWSHAVLESTLDGFVLKSPNSNSQNNSSTAENSDAYRTPSPVRTNAMGEIVRRNSSFQDKAADVLPFLPRLDTY